MKCIYVIALIASVGIFNSCTEKFLLQKSPDKQYTFSAPSRNIPDTIYGTYLAGRVAHIRQHYDIAADYYIKTVNLGTYEPEVFSTIYLLLASEGRIEEAAQYALKAREKGDEANLISFILMSKDMKAKDYKKAYEDTLMVLDKPFQKTILPLFQGWILVASGKQSDALKAIDALKNEEGLAALYHMHKGMMYDYFGETEAAFENYEVVINDETMPLSFRALQIIGNFYLRNGEKEKIIKVAEKYYEQNNETPMLGDLIESFKEAEPEKIEKLIDTPQKGLAEAVFNVGTIFRGFQNEVAQLFTSLVLYLNPDFEVARVAMGDLYEQSDRYQKAAEEYLKIKEDSPVYYVTQLKIATNYMGQDKHKEAFEILNNLHKKYPKSEHVLFRLGEISRVMGKYDKAAEFYQKALDQLPLSDGGRWAIYYALGIAYERQNKWDNAEEIFKKALELSHRHPYVLNYLGYSWIERGINYNEALYMIFEAHHKNSQDGHILDSLGWAIYKMGRYEDAAVVLERASEYLPSNAIVFDHLGDAYWQSGRKDEARFQWKHALQAKEDKEEIDISEIKKKIKTGMEKASPIPFNEKLLTDRIKALEETVQQ